MCARVQHTGLAGLTMQRPSDLDERGKTFWMNEARRQFDTASLRRLRAGVHEQFAQLDGSRLAGWRLGFRAPPKTIGLDDCGLRLLRTSTNSPNRRQRLASICGSPLYSDRLWEALYPEAKRNFDFGLQ